MRKGEMKHITYIMANNSFFSILYFYKPSYYILLIGDINKTN